MAGIFPTPFTGGVSPTVSLPYSYTPQFTNQPFVAYYPPTGCITLTAPQFNSLFSELACLFDHAGWTYQPGNPCNLWGALKEAFGSGGGGVGPIAGIQSVNGKTGAAVNLAVADIPGAAPLANPHFTQAPTAPTGAPGDDSSQIATDAFVQREIIATIQKYSGPAATTTTAGNVTLATAATLAAGKAGAVPDAALLQSVGIPVYGLFGNLIGHVLP